MTDPFKKNHYPELTKAGGLDVGLDNTFKTINSELRVDPQDEEWPFDYARVGLDNKFSQIYIAQNEKLYLPDYWRDGVCLANGHVSDIKELAKSIDYWINNDISINELNSIFGFVRPNVDSLHFDNGNEVEHMWNQFLENGSEELKPFIQLAIDDEVVNKLFPFTSLFTLCFSRCTGYPYDSKGLPSVTTKTNSWTLPKRDNLKGKSDSDSSIFIVTKNKTEYIGEGSANDALRLVKEHLPPNIEKARKGTAEE